MSISIKQQILDSINNATNKLGWSLITEEWGNETLKCACALGCVLINENPSELDIFSSETEENVAETAKILGVTELWVKSFIQGFDDGPVVEDFGCPDAYRMGKEIRDETISVPYYDFN